MPTFGTPEPISVTIAVATSGSSRASADGASAVSHPTTAPR
jgi:hypothetical protein